MKAPPAPLRFLAVVTGGWVLVRAATLIPLPNIGGQAETGDTPRTAMRPQPAQRSLATSVPGQSRAPGATRARPDVPFRLPAPIMARTMPSSAGRPEPATAREIAFALGSTSIPEAAPTPPPIAAAGPFVALPASPRSIAVVVGSSRCFGLAFPASRRPRPCPWCRNAGASQAGGRATYRLAGAPSAPLALSLRMTAALDRPSESEAAFGLDWRPLRQVPIHIVAERRQAIGRAGRSDFAVTVYGGATRRVGPIVVDGYGQAGIVGRDAFADGALRITRPTGPVDVGAGLWGGAQPGASRVDIGPHVSARLPVAGAMVRAAAEWRFRIAGEAAPASGPALTIATDF